MFKRRRNRRRQNSQNSDALQGSSSTNTTSTPVWNGHKPKASSLRGGSTTNSHNSALDSSTRGGNRASEGGSAASGTVSTRSSTAVKHVRFLNVEVREYERILANNPSCSSGAPVGIGWAHTKERKIELDEYESNRTRRRSQIDLVLTRQQREAILLEWGATFNEIVDAVRSNIRIKNQRRHTVSTLGRYDKWEEMMESAGRRLKRTILLQKPTSQRARELSAQVQRRHHHHHGVHHAVPMVNGAKTPIQEAKTAEDQELEQIRAQLSRRGLVAPQQLEQIQAQLSHRSLSQALSHRSLSHRSLVPSLVQSLVPSEQLPPSADCTPPQNNFSAEGGAPPPVQAALMDGEESISLGLGPDMPVLEVDILGGSVGDVSSRISYDEDLTIDTSDYDYYSQADDADDDGFGQLIRDTRHWYIDGNDAPQLQRRVTPTIILEEPESEYDQQQPMVQYYDPQHFEPQPLNHQQAYELQQQLLHYQLQQQQQNPQQQTMIVLDAQTWQQYQQQQGGFVAAMPPPPQYSQAMPVHWE